MMCIQLVLILKSGRDLLHNLDVLLFFFFLVIPAVDAEVNRELIN